MPAMLGKGGMSGGGGGGGGGGFYCQLASLANTPLATYGWRWLLQSESSFTSRQRWLTGDDNGRRSFSVGRSLAFMVPCKTGCASMSLRGPTNGKHSRRVDDGE